jgi:hypothetical protein
MVILNNLACRHDPSCRCAVQPETPLQITSGGEKNLLYTGERLIGTEFYTCIQPGSGCAAGNGLK